MKPERRRIGRRDDAARERRIAYSRTSTSQ